MVEEFEVEGKDLIGKVKELVKDASVKRITIKSEEGKTLMEFPLTVGIVGIVLLPIWAAVGAIAALVTKATISVERG